MVVSDQGPLRLQRCTAAYLGERVVRSATWSSSSARSSAPRFVLFGGILLEPALGHLSWSVVGYAVLSLTVVRIMLPVALAMLGTHARPATLGFLGWFGPRGLASIVFAILVIEAEGTLPQENLLLTTVFVTVGLSVLLHGLTAAALARRYARWFETHRERAELSVEEGAARHVR
jgi:NhaP-type Na+/H+ or K+/H+ antiporter